MAEKVAMGPFGSNIKVETFKTEGIPIISGQHLHETRLRDGTFDFITEEHANNLSNSNVFRGDVVFTHAGNIGQVSFIPTSSRFERYVLSQRQFYLRCNKEKIDHEFITYYFRSPYGQYQILANSSQTGVPALAQPVTAIKNLEVLLPPLSEQKAIAEVLSSLDDKIDLLHRQNKTLENMAQALFRQWFVEEADEGWDIKKLEDVLTVKGGTTPSTKETEYWDGNISWATPKDLSNHNSVFLFDTGRKITLQGLEQIGSGLLPVGTVLLSSRAPIGYLAISNIPLSINQGYIAILCDKVLSNYFVYLWCSNNIDMIKSYGHGTVFREISKSVFRKLDICVPPANKLSIFDKVIHPFFQKIRTNQSQIHKLENLRDILLPKLVSGKVKLR